MDLTLSHSSKSQPSLQTWGLQEKETAKTMDLNLSHSSKSQPSLLDPIDEAVETYHNLQQMYQQRRFFLHLCHPLTAITRNLTHYSPVSNLKSLLIPVFYHLNAQRLYTKLSLQTWMEGTLNRKRKLTLSLLRKLKDIKTI